MKADDPLVDLTRQFEASQALIAHLEKTRVEDDPAAELEWDAAFDRDFALRKEIMATPAAGLVGVALKTIVAAMVTAIDRPVDGGEWKLDSDRRILLSAADDAKRLLGC